MSEIDQLSIRACVGVLPTTQSRLVVLANMNYVGSIPKSECPVSYTYQPPPGIRWENIEYERKHISIFDSRNASIQPSIEREGFELRDAPTAVTDFTDPDEVVSTYYKEAEELALAVTGAQKAYVFDHLVRKREIGQSDLTFGRRIADGTAGANGRIHNDYTEQSGRKRLSLVITDPAEAARVSRYSIVNIWRAIRGPVLDTPLAICDARTLAAKDLVICNVKYPNRTGEIYLFTYSAAHKWSYFSHMERHEALVFKQYDSQISGTTRFTPHAAFDHPDAPIGGTPRQSIELRCLVTY